MKEWFKARNVWGAAIKSLSDEEAGRLAKAIWSYTMTGEAVEIEGAGKGIYALVLMTLGQDEEHEADVSAKRSDAARVMHLHSNASKCMQMQANATNKNKNKNKKEDEEQEKESESFIDEDDAQRIAIEHERVLDAAEDAGFKMSNDVRARLIALYAYNGLDKMLEGFRSCVDHGVPTLAYLKAVLKGEPKKTTQKANVPAQAYTQRSYDGEQEDAMRRMLRVVSE